MDMILLGIALNAVILAGGLIEKAFSKKEKEIEFEDEHMYI